MKTTPALALLDAAERLLAAREDQMVTKVEWDRLARAAASYRRGLRRGRTKKRT